MTTPADLQPPSVAAENDTTRCAACGAAMVCGALAGEAACWCAALPPLTAPVGGGCYCRACLSERLAAQAASLNE